MLMAGRRAGANKFFVNVVRRYTLPAYVALFGAMCAFTFVLGNKNEVFMALVTGFLAYMGAARGAPVVESRAGDRGGNVVSLRHRFLSRGARSRKWPRP